MLFDVFGCVRSPYLSHKLGIEVLYMATVAALEHRRTTESTEPLFRMLPDIQPHPTAEALALRPGLERSSWRCSGWDDWWIRKSWDSP